MGYKFYSKGQLANMNLAELCDALLEARDQVIKIYDSDEADDIALRETVSTQFDFVKNEVLDRLVLGCTAKLLDLASYQSSGLSPDQVKDPKAQNQEFASEVEQQKGVIKYLEKKLDDANQFAAKLMKDNEFFHCQDENYPGNC